MKKRFYTKKHKNDYEHFWSVARQCHECKWWDRKNAGWFAEAKCLRRVKANKKRKWLKISRGAWDQACGWFREVGK